MKITDMIMEWRKGCSCCSKKAIECNECTFALIKAIDEKSFMDECEVISEAAISKNGVFGIAMAAGQVAMKIKQRDITIRAINEQANKKD